jgi:hypothetical protein
VLDEFLLLVYGCILVSAGSSIPFNRKVQSTELFRDPESILMLAQFLGGVMGNNVVVCASTGGFCHEGPAYVIVDSSFFDGCLENNRWDVYISVGDPSMTTPRTSIIVSIKSKKKQKEFKNRNNPQAI